jgi:excisionase family DNA binding protein
MAAKTTSLPKPEGQAATSEAAQPAERTLFDFEGAAGYARELGAYDVTAYTIRRLAASGELPFIRGLGRKFYVSKKSLDSWIAANDRRAL